MSDAGKDYRAIESRRKRLRVRCGVPCPRCKEQRPKAQPTILIPGQRCFDGYRDPRKEIPQEEGKTRVEVAE